MKINNHAAVRVSDYSYKTLTCDSPTCAIILVSSLQHAFAMKTVQFEKDSKIHGLKELIIQ